MRFVFLFKEKDEICMNILKYLLFHEIITLTFFMDINYIVLLSIEFFLEKMCQFFIQKI
jgi:hypothetical protein